MILTSNMDYGIGDSIQDFEVYGPIGSGGFATVHEARCLKPGYEHLHVAVKMISKMDLKRLKRIKERVRQEISIHSRLKHPSIVEYYTDFEDDKFVYLILELCKKGSLEDYLKKNQCPFTEDEARELLRPVINGIMYLHSKRVIHRDLSLRNLLLTEDLQVKIADFGMATELSQPDEKKYTMLGTANYMPPEMAVGASHSFEADYWSLGCLLYALLVGKPPFDDKGVRKTLTNVVSSECEIPDHLSIEAKRLIKLLLTKNPNERIKINDIFKHDFFIKSPARVMDNSYYTQRTVDSGVGSTLSNSMSLRSSRKSYGLADSAINSMTTTSARYNSDYSGPPGIHTMDRLTHKLDTIYSSEYGWTGNEKEFDRQHYKQQEELLQTHPKIPYMQSKNQKIQNGYVGQLKNKIQTLPSRINNFLHPSLSQERLLQNHYQKERHLSEESKNEVYSCAVLKENPPFKSQEIYQEKQRRYISEDHCQSNSRSPSRFTKDIPSNDCYAVNAHCKKCTEFTQQNRSCDKRCSSPHENCHLHPSHSSCSHNGLCFSKKVQCSHQDGCSCRRSFQCNTRCEHNSDHSDHIHSTTICPKSVASHPPSLKRSVPPLSTARLAPRRMEFKTAIISIVSNGDVCLEFFKLKRDKKYVTNVYQISRDGMWITVYKPGDSKCLVGRDPPPIPPRGADGIYGYESLPENQWKKYIQVARFVNMVRAKTPKITLYGEMAKCVMMENTPDPDFEVSFYNNGGYIAKTTKKVTITDKNGKVHVFKSVDDVKYMKSKLGVLWKEFLKMQDACQTLEKSIVSGEESIKSIFQGDANVSCFPTILGRKPHCLSTPLKENNKENIFSPTSVLSLTNSIRTYDSRNELMCEKNFGNTNLRRYGSLASLHSTKSDSHLSVGQKMKSMNEIWSRLKEPPKILQNGQIFVSYKDGTQIWSSRSAKEIHFLDTNTNQRYNQDSECLPPHVRQKAEDLMCILSHFSKS